MKTYYERNRESRIKYGKDYYQKNREKLLKNKNKYNQKPEVKKKQKEWRENNRKRIKEYNKKHNQRPEVKKRQKEWRDNIENKKRRKEHLREYYKIPKVKEQIKLRRQLYAKQNKEYIREYIKKYHKVNYKEDKEFMIKMRLRSNFFGALKTYTKTGKIYSSKKYGINYKEIIEHLKPFPEDLSKYHIDHIKPLCSFEFVCNNGSTNLEEIKKAFTPSNLQWLTIKENLEKGGKLIIPNKI